MQIDRVKTVDKIGVVRDHRWLSADEQAKRLAARCRIVVSLGGGKTREIDRDALTMLARPGCVIELVHAFLLAEPSRRLLSSGMRGDFRSALAALEKRGAQVFDLTADISSDKRQAFLAVVDADIGVSNRGRASKANGEKSQRGRRRYEPSEDDLRRAEAIWGNTKRYPDWEAAAEALKREVPKFTVFRAWKTWGTRFAPKWKKDPNRKAPTTGWRPIPFAPSYEAHPSGLVRNKATQRIMDERKLPTGYSRMSLSLDGHPDAYLHAAILETFVGPRPDGCQVSHKNGDNADNRLSNLAWETASKNNRRKRDHGTALVGAENVQGRKTHCPAGHPYDEKNTRRANGKRVCRTCARENMRRRRAAGN